MSKRLSGAKAIIAQMGEELPEDEKSKNRASAKKDAEKPNEAKAIVGVEQRDKLTTTVAKSTSSLIAKIQAHYLEMGYKKPSAGKLIDEALAEFAKSRGVGS